MQGVDWRDRVNWQCNGGENPCVPTSFMCPAVAFLVLREVLHEERFAYDRKLYQPVDESMHFEFN